MTEKHMPNVPASQLCRLYNVQNCHECDDLECKDNTNKKNDFYQQYQGDGSIIPEGNYPVSELQRQAHANAVEKGWHDTERSAGEFICLMYSELSEALEELRYGRRPDEVYFSTDFFDKNHNKPEGVPIELADCVIRILDFCGKHNINLQQALAMKMAYNKTRPYRHGGKKL